MLLTLALSLVAAAPDAGEPWVLSSKLGPLSKEREAVIAALHQFGA